MKTPFTKSFRSYFLFVVALGATFSFSGCDSLSDGGYPVVAYKLPDIVIGRAEGWNRDLESNPRIFEHTGNGTYLTYDAYSSDTRVADAYVREGILHVIAGLTGTTTVHVSAKDSDGDITETTFKAQIVP